MSTKGVGICVADTARQNLYPNFSGLGRTNFYILNDKWCFRFPSNCSFAFNNFSFHYS